MTRIELVVDSWGATKVWLHAEHDSLLLHDVYSTPPSAEYVVAAREWIAIFLRVTGLNVPITETDPHGWGEGTSK